MSSEPMRVPVAYIEACEKLVRVHGNGPYDGLRWIGQKDDESFSLVGNASRDKQEHDGVPYAFIHVYRNGWPVGVLTPYDGGMIGAMEAGETEREFIEWCRSDLTATAFTELRATSQANNEPKE